MNLFVQKQDANASREIHKRSLLDRVKRIGLPREMVETSNYELLSASKEKKVNEQLELIKVGAPMSGDTERRIASLAYINADYTSGMGVLSGLLGVTSIFISITTTEMNLVLAIITGIVALMLLAIAIMAALKFFNTDTAKQVAFTIHQSRCANLKSRTDSEKILAGIEELRNRNATQEPGFIHVPPTKDLNTKLWLSLLIAIAITARKRSR